MVNLNNNDVMNFLYDVFSEDKLQDKKAFYFVIS